MFEGQSVAVVIPSHNVATLIESVLHTLPAFVDRAVVVDDASHDGTAEAVQVVAKSPEWSDRLVLLQHDRNRGVGAAIASGYAWCRDQRIDITVVMAGDGQMDPGDLPSLIRPIIDDEADYTKGNRLRHPDAWRAIPGARIFGIIALSLLTKPVSGYWRVWDSQSGYTAVSLRMLDVIEIERIYPRYGMPNDLLAKLNVAGARVADVPVRPVYNVGESSGMCIPKVACTIPLLLTRLFFWRMFRKLFPKGEQQAK